MGEAGREGVHRPWLVPLYLPALLVGVPAQAVLVLLPLYVLALGGGAAEASAVVGLRGIGMMAMDIPAGLVAARIGDKRLMVLATAAMAAAFLALALAPAVWWLALAALVLGMGSSAFMLARMSHLAATCPPLHRGRVIAMLAGLMRVASLVGPAAGGWLAHVAGYPAVFLLAAAASIAAGVVVAARLVPAAHHGDEPGLAGMVRIARGHATALAGGGSAAVSIMLMRAARTVLLPLVGAAIGLGPAEVGAIVAASAAADVALFYPAGVLLDRLGRRRIAIPGSAALALTIGTLALVGGPWSLAAAAVAVGLANGMTTGIVMTLGTDLAPAVGRAAFLGLWRLLGDLGMAAGPLVVSAVSAVAPLAAAPVTVAAIGILGSWAVWRYVPETLPQRSSE